MIRHLVVPALSLILVLAGGTSARAAQIGKVKGKAVLIRSDGDTLKEGDVFFAMSAAGKKKAIVRVTKIKGDKALGVLVKGKAQAGMTLTPRTGGAGAGKVAKSKRTQDTTDDSPGEHKRAYWGGMLGYGMDSMTVAVVKSTTNEPFGTSAMTGSGFSAKGLFDYELFPQIWFRGTTGIEQLNVTGTAICATGNKSPCDAKIMYFTFDMIGRYKFEIGKYHPWLGGGVGLLFPATKSSTALKATSIGTTNVMILAGGVDWHFNGRMYIPVSVEYGLLPKSDAVEAHLITLRAGLAIPF